MSKKSVHIIGGGVAGIATALKLGRAGDFAPVILEREKRTGGLARCLTFKGVSTDMGPHRIHTELPEVEELTSEVCAPSLYTVQRKSRIYVQGHYIDYPPSPFEVLRRLGPVTVSRFGFGMVAEMFRPTPTDEKYDSLMRHAFGSGAYDLMLRPYSAKVWKTDPTEIHVDTAKVRVSAGSLAKMIKRLFAEEKKGSETALKEFRYVKGGIETMVRHLQEKAEEVGTEVRVEAPVKKLHVEASGEGTYRVTELEYESENGSEPRKESVDTVVSTVPVPVLVREMLPELPELAEAREAAEGLTYLNVIFVLAIVKRKIISGDNWLYFPGPDLIFNRAYESKTFDPDMGPEDKSVICIEITTRPGDEIDSQSDEELTRQTIEQMTATGLFDADEIEETMVYRLDYGYPLYSLDYHDRLEKVFNGLRCIKNLVTSGRQGLFNHNNTDHSMLMGLRAAEAIIASEDGECADAWYDKVDEFKRIRIVD